MVRKIFFFLFAATTAFCEEDVAKISEAMGHLIGKNLQSLGLPLNIEALVKGMQDEASGKASPLNEEECVEAIASLQEESLAQVAEKNLAEATAFLSKNRERKGVVSLEEGKLQYEIVKQGEGQIVQPYNAPLVRYQGRFANGAPIGSTEEIISLDEAILGFSKGLVGMKEKEVRTLYIHPELGYGKGGNSHPNSLLIFDIEIIKADASSEAHAASNREIELIAPRKEAETLR